MILRQACPRTTNLGASVQDRGPAPQPPVSMIREEGPGGAGEPAAVAPSPSRVTSVWQSWRAPLILPCSSPRRSRWDSAPDHRASPLALAEERGA
jgi:hypothetical protein